jgi:RHS repeat-associated protein
MSINSTLQYVHQAFPERSRRNHLIGTSLMTSANGALLGTIKYTPFGETRSILGELYTDKLFTGQRLDGIGLYFYNARYYDPAIGRFISPDTIIPSPANPQSFNRYSYCLNNPLKYTDPSGYWTIAIEWKFSFNLRFFHVEAGFSNVVDNRNNSQRFGFWSAGLGSGGSGKLSVSLTGGLVTTNAESVKDLDKEVRIGVNVIPGAGLGYETIKSVGKSRYTGSCVNLGFGIDIGPHAEYSESKPWTLPWEKSRETISPKLPLEESPVTTAPPEPEQQIGEQIQREFERGNFAPGLVNLYNQNSSPLTIEDILTEFEKGKFAPELVDLYNQMQ